MQIIDLLKWDRTQIFNFFKDTDCPHYSITANIDVVNLYKFCKRNNLSFYYSMIYLVTKTCNSIQEFRYRIREDCVVFHEVIKPSFTLPTKNNLFRFSWCEYEDDLFKFVSKLVDSCESKVEDLIVNFDFSKDDFIFLSCTPWIHFTSFTNPYNTKMPDTFPRITWGKYIWVNNSLTMPVSVQVHHALVDGYHLGMFYEKLQAFINKID